MPIASNKKRQAKIIKEKSSKNNWWQKVILVIVLIVAAIGVASFFTQERKVEIAMINEGARMEEYLNNKYGQEFVVENVRETGTGFAVKGSWRGDAYPKSDPSLKFEIRRSQTTDKINYETFLQVLWTKEGTPEVEEFLAREFPHSEGYTLKIAPVGRLYDSIEGETPSLQQVMINNKDALTYSLNIRNIVSTISEEPSDTQLNNAMMLVSFVKNKGVKYPSVNYGYRDASFDQKNDAGQQLYKYSIRLEDADLNSISSTEELKQYFKTVR